jgi:hypothetical protein
VVDPIAEDKRRAEAHLPRCVECEDEVATRQCNECIDSFCDGCYDSVHAKGKLAVHTYVVTYTPLTDEYERVMQSAGKDDVDEGLGEWEEYFDGESGAPYWYSANTGETRWDDPKLSLEVEAYADGNGEEVNGFQEYFDEASGLPYWFNVETQETTWDNPAAGVHEYAADDTGAVDAYYDPEAAGYDQYDYAQPAAEGVAADGHEWEQYVDDGTGLPYWFNSTTQETTWDDPYAT